MSQTWYKRIGQTARTLTLDERYYERGLHYYTKNNLDAAILDLDEALLHSPHNAEYYVVRGLMLLQNNQAGEAEEDFAQGLNLDPTQWLAHYGRGLQTFNASDYAAAIDHFSRAQRIAPERPEIYFHRAVAFHYLHNSDEALRDMEFAQQLLESKDKRHNQAKQWLTIFNTALQNSSTSA